jgi:hypothetical protein
MIMKSRRWFVAETMVILFCLTGSSGCASAPGMATITPSPTPVPITPALIISETLQLIATSTTTPVQEASSISIHPIAVYPPYDSPSGYLLGGIQDGNWVDAATTAASLKGGESYSLYSDAAFLGKSIGTVPRMGAPSCPDMQDITLDPIPQVNPAIAIGGEWNALPRVLQDISTENWIYLQAVNDLLTDNGIVDPKVQLTRVLKTDLEGDGVDEILIAASYFYEETGHNVTAGDYSIVVLRKVMGNEVVTLPMPADFYFRSQQFTFPEKYTLTAVLDLNGDGRMEIIVGITGWEKAGSLVYEVVDFEIRNVLAIQCP